MLRDVRQHDNLQLFNLESYFQGFIPKNLNILKSTRVLFAI